MAREIRYDINGLKAIAIISIVLYHFFDLLNLSHVTNVTLFNGGFLGVDVFFVVSGFLITSGIIYKLKTDSFKLIDFYKRRFFRILPPLFPVCIFTLVAGYFFLFPEVYSETLKEIKYALIFTGNFRFANSGGYFSMDSSDKVLLHTWYLCITIQFYLLYPIVLLLLSKLFKERFFSLSVFIITVVLIVLSIICSQKGSGYLLTQCRIWELFFGGLVFAYSDKLKVLVFDKNKYLSLFVEVFGISFVLYSIFFIELTNGRWYFSTSILSVIGTSLILLAHNCNSVLKNSFFSIIGKTSYSLYLWHWPILAIAVKWGFNTSFASVSGFIVILSLCVLVSYRFFENIQYSVKTILCSYLIILCTVIVLRDCDIKSYLSNYVYDFRNEVDETNFYSISHPFYKIGEDTVYIYSQKENLNKTPHVFIIGDSHLGHFENFFKESLNESIYLYSIPAMAAYGPVTSNIKTEFFYGLKERHIFFNVYEKMLSVLKDGDRVIFSNRWDVQINPYSKDRNLKYNVDTAKLYVSDLISDLDNSISRYPNLKFYIIGQGIVLKKESEICSKILFDKLFYNNIINTDKCYKSADANIEIDDVINNALWNYAQSKDNVTFVHRDDAIKIDDGLYTIKQGNVPLFMDDNHLSNLGARIIGRTLFKDILSLK